MQGIVDVTRGNAGDGFASNLSNPGDPPPDGPINPMDSVANQGVLRRLEDWWLEARDCHAENRREQMMDADYYDCIQWMAMDAAVLLDRGQAPLTFPLIKQMCDWLIGTERRTRIDWDVLPRKDSDVPIAQVKKEVLKWVSDINGSGWERSRQFSDVVKVGIGWTEQCFNNDKLKEGVTDRYIDWKSIWWDPYSRSNVLRDCRYVTRAKWLDLDYAIAMWPDRANALNERAIGTVDPALEMLELEANLPQMFYNSPNPLLAHNTTGTFGLYGSSSVTRGPRKRILVLETWFTRAVNTPLIMGDDVNDLDDLTGKAFDPNNNEHQSLLSNGVISLTDSVTEQMWMAIWSPGLLLRVNKSPYKHNKFPFTPAWAYRRHRDGMPYGSVRPARDAQDEYNKRRSKILFELSTNRVIYTSDAMDEADEATNLEEAKRPDGEVRLANGKMDSFRIDNGTDRVEGQIKMLAESKQNIYEASGVTRENTGTSAGDQSGRAILAKQQQGAATTAELFDNYRQSIQESGQKTLSNCEQFLSLPKIVRISGPNGAMQWMKVNQPSFDPTTGKVLWHNDITASEADFIVDETDYRETVRMAMSEMLFEMIGRMPPNVALALLDIAVEMTDLPNKDALANRIRQVTGQAAPGQENSPEAQAAAQQKQQQVQASQQLDLQQKQATVGLTNAKTTATQAKATLDTATATHRTIEGKAAAMETAGMVHA
ncbi:MAG: hypothetical protein WA777_18550, partial [Rhodanobacter sp.]